MSTPPKPLVSVEWLAARLDDNNVRIIDASWYMPQTQNDAGQEFLERHIPGAVRFDLDKIAAPSTDLPHMAASTKDFSNAVGAKGISNENTIIIYDVPGLFSAARVWWNFRIMGAKEVYVLDGGLTKWIADGQPVESGISHHKPTVFAGKEGDGDIVNAATILSLVESSFPNGEQIVDVRSSDRFFARVVEPRVGLRSGHIPGSKNLPFTDLVKDGRLLPPDALEAKLVASGMDLKKPIISTCGSGVTAPILNLALATLGFDSLKVYDGSWTEWGASTSLPVSSSE